MNTNKFSTIKLEVTNNIATITLNRPDYHNAFNELMISELSDAYKFCEEENNLRIVILRVIECAGADLNWMKSIRDYTYEQNIEDAKRFADLLNIMHSIKKATICVVQGDVYGGGIGLVVTSDIIICDESASFTFTELKFGIIPACISPYILKRLQPNIAKYFYLTQEKINAKRAFEVGLVDVVSSRDAIENTVQEYCKKILRAAPQSISVCKKFLDELSDKNLLQQIDCSVQTLANIRTSSEAKEGFNAFFEKRKPFWT